MENFDIFGSTSIDVNSHKPQATKESVIYSPKAKDAADGVYNAKVRFLYNPNDPVNGSIIKKIVYYLKDQEDKGYYFDSPQSVGDWAGCPIGKLWKQLDQSDSAVDRNNAKQLNRREVFYSLVYVISDSVNPSNNGKIKVFKYGKKLKAKLDRYLEPTSGPKVDIFNFYTGYNFDLHITRQGNFNDYDQAGFEIQPSQISLSGLTGDASTDRTTLQKFMESAPNLDEYRYKAWDDTERARLESILNQFRSPGQRVSSIVNDRGNVETPNATVVQPNAQMTSSNTAPVVAPVVSTTTPVQSTVTEASADEDLDGFLDGLGI
jgi:hypothetical protein